MTDAALFDVESLRVAPAPAVDPDLSADRRRTLRQTELIRQGLHPLAAVARGLRLHADADRDAEAGKLATGPTCGGCIHRVLVRWHNRTYAKCNHGNKPGQALDYAPRASHAGATDCRAWWPACETYQPLPEASSPSE